MAERIRSGAPLQEAVKSVLGGWGHAEPESAATVESHSRGLSVWDRLFKGLGDGDYEAADQTYREMTENLGLCEQIIEVLAPAFVESGERWFRREFEVYQERFSAGFLRAKAIEALAASRRANRSPSRRAVIATPSGDWHEGGPLMISTLLELAGWRAICLGSNVPAGDLQQAIDRWRPDAVGISFVLSRNTNKRFAELGKLRGSPVFIGGRSIVNHTCVARRHGLIPLPGRGDLAVRALIEEVEGIPCPELNRCGSA